MTALALYAAEAALREQLAALAREAGCRIAGTAETPLALRRLLDEVSADAIVTLISPGTEWSAWLAERRAPFIVLTAEDATEPLRTALAAGAASILPQDTSAAALRLAIDAMKQGLSIMPAALLDTLREEDSDASRLGDAATLGDALTPRELQVLAAMADGASNKAIARRLGISFHTVKFHVAAIFEKLDADSRTEAVTEAARRGLVML